VSVEQAIGRVLDRLSDDQIEALATASAVRRSPGTSLSHAVVGASPATHDAVARLAHAWGATDGLTGAGVALALRTGLAARSDASARRSRPVWTGPGASGEQRLTAAVLGDLVRCATERVLIVSFAAFTLSGLAGDLVAAVDRGCDVDVVFETEDDSSGAYSGPHSVPFGSVAGITRWRWPADQRDPGALLHAKLLVVDGRRALVGSANLTHRALSANLEAGVLIEDGDVARQLERHVRSLMADGVLHDS
jgi:phosphatidylserine/phosphatidylglycerophosphate/cardiolipin synthase-like enzyme